MAHDAFRNRYGPTALVTGASSGIGWGFAEELADRGFDLILTARRTDRLETLAAQLKETNGVKVTIVAADLADPAAPAKLLAAAGPDVGLVVSNAGFGMKGAHETNDAPDMTDMLMVNCNTPLQLAHGFLPRFKAAGKGGIVFVSSVEGLMGCPYSTVYSASKALVNAMGEGLWGELIGSGIDVLTVCPGATESEAAGKQGIDIRTLPNVLPARDVAAASLDNIAEGPIFFPSEFYRAGIAQLLTMPKREALAVMAKSMSQ